MPGASVTDVPSDRSPSLGLFVALRRRFLTSLAPGAVSGNSTLLSVAFWAHGFSLVQGFVVILVPFFALAGKLGGRWVSFGLRFARRSVG